MKSREWLFSFFSSLVTVPVVPQGGELAPEVVRSNHLKELPTLARVKERDCEIVIKSDGENLYYTVLNDDCGITLENVSLEEIHATNPELYERLKVTVAEPRIDAGTYN